MEIYNEIKRKLQAFTTEIYEHIIKNRFKIDLNRGCALDEHQKKAQEEAIIFVTNDDATENRKGLVRCLFIDVLLILTF